MQQSDKRSPNLGPAQYGTATGSDEPLFFHMPDEQYGEFCQWFPGSFTISETRISSLLGHGTDAQDAGSTITFTCAEQFMMYRKAGRFHDRETQRKVLATASPKEQKRLGKLTVGFTNSSWDEVKSAVVVAGNIAKFGQNPKLKGKLLSTGDRLLVEAASDDRMWGIGYTAKQAMSHRQHWGDNRLRKALMDVRERLRHDDENDGRYGWVYPAEE